MKKVIKKKKKKTTKKVKRKALVKSEVSASENIGMDITVDLLQFCDKCINNAANVSYDSATKSTTKSKQQNDPFLINMINTTMSTLNCNQECTQDYDSSDDLGYDSTEEGSKRFRARCLKIYAEAEKLGPTDREKALYRYRCKRKARKLLGSKVHRYPRRQNYASKRVRKDGRFVTGSRFVNPWFD